jgi:hypothetical protein
LPNAPAKREA